MRRTFGLCALAAAIAMVVGCFTPGTPAPEVAGPVGPPTGDKDHTLEYWGKVREVMRLASASSDMRQLADAVRKQADTVRRLPVDGVDMELVVAANAIAQSQEKELKAAEAAGYNPASLRSDPDLKNAYITAGQQVTAAIARLKGLAPRLSARYGVTFPPIEDKTR